MRRRIGTLTLALATAAGALTGFLPATSAVGVPSCSTPARPALAKAIKNAVANGQMSAAEGARVTCNSAQLYAPSSFAVKARLVSPGSITTHPPQASGKVSPDFGGPPWGCRNSAEWDISWTNDGVTAGGIKVALEWCYGNYTITSYTGYCVGYTTGFGQAEGWVGGCDVNQYYFPAYFYTHGLLRHITQGHWSAPAIGITFHASVKADMYGYYSGACNTQFDGRYWPYC